MKQIQPIQIWQNGQVKAAEILNSYSSFDDLKSSAIFYYSLLTKDNEQLAQGSLTMSGSDYTGFTNNEYAYDWVATQLNAIIIGDASVL